MTVKHTLLTGASGFLGSVVVKRLMAEGHHVRAAVRRKTQGLPDAVEQVAIGDLADNPDWSAAVAGIDAIIHLAARAHVIDDRSEDPLSLFRAVNRDATLDLARVAATAGVKNFVFVSTIGVNGAATYGTAFGPEDEAHPHSPYAIAKWEAEQGLRDIAKDTPMALTIVRPPLILGDHPKGNLATMHRMIARGLPLPLASVRKNARDFVSSERLAAFLVASLSEPRCRNRLFTVCDGQPLSTRELIIQEATRLGVKPRLVPFPPSLLATALNLLGKSSMADQLTGDLEVDGSAANAILAEREPKAGHQS